MRLSKKGICILLLSALSLAGCSNSGTSSKGNSIKPEDTNKIEGNVEGVAEEISADVVEDGPWFSYTFDGRIHKLKADSGELIAMDEGLLWTEKIKDIHTNEEWIFETMREDDQVALYYRESEGSGRILVDKANILWPTKTIDQVTKEEYIWYSKADETTSPEGEWELENVTAYIIPAGQTQGIELGFDIDSGRGVSSLAVVDRQVYYSTNISGNKVVTKLFDSYSSIDPEGAHLPVNVMYYLDLTAKSDEAMDGGMIFDPWEYRKETEQTDSLSSLPYCDIIFADEDYIYVSRGNMNGDFHAINGIYTISTDTKEIKPLYDFFGYTGGATTLVEDGVFYVGSGGRISDTVLLRFPLKNQCEPLEIYDASLIGEKDGWVYYFNDGVIYRVQTAGDITETVHALKADTFSHRRDIIGDWLIITEINTNDDEIHYRLNVNTKEIVEIESETPLANIVSVQEYTNNKTYFTSNHKNEHPKGVYLIDTETFEIEFIASGN